MAYPEYMNCYENLRESMKENISTNYMVVGEDPEFLTVCTGWLMLLGYS